MQLCKASTASTGATLAGLLGLSLALTACDPGPSGRDLATAERQHAIVNGEIMAQDGRCLRVNEAELLAELREEMPAFLAAHEETEAMNRAFEAAFWQVHRKANGRDVGVHRMGQEPAWT